MANGRINFGKQSGGVLGLLFPDGVTNTEVTLPASGTLATTEFATSQDLGVGQTWHNVTASRSVGVAYTNTTGKPIMINICMDTYISYQKIEVGGIDISGNASMGGGNPIFIVPNNTTYKFVYTNAGTMRSWCELR